MSESRYDIGLQALEGLRGALDDDLLDAALAAVRERRDAAQQAVQPHQQLRQVTVMFVDVVGSTALGGRLAPEDIHAVMDTALARFTGIVERHGGRALQYAGDSLLAAFGTLESREDDAENAVAAGLALLAEARLLADGVHRQHGQAVFNVRVGLHTGPVLLGGGVDAGNTIRGATVNLAARMEQSAPPGALRISDDTARLVQGLFDLVDQPPLQVKGHDAPLTTWLVARRHPQRAATLRRGVAGLHTPLVGRDGALAQLDAAWQALRAPGAGTRLVSVVAEAGLGKARLLQHWQDSLHSDPPQALWLRVRARPQAERLPFALLHDLVCEALNLPDSDSPATARDRFTAAVAPYLADDTDSSTAEADAHVLGHLLGLNFSDSPHLRGIAQQGGQIRQRALNTLAELLVRLGRQQGLPLVLVLDDLHWADAASLGFIQGLPERSSSAAQPLLLLALARPGLDERQPGWAQAEHDRIHLQPLGEDASHALADGLVAPLRNVADNDAEAVAALHQLLVDRAGGNPFFMEELLQMLVAQGSIQPLAATDGTEAATTGPRWLLQGPIHPASLPATLNGVLQAQLDVLPAEQRLALQQAAVAGPVFWTTLLAALDDRAPTQLPALLQRGLLQQREAGSPDNPASYGFSHAFLQQVAYGRLLRADRQALHARAAQWYAGLGTARAADYLSVAADHFEQAAQPLDAARYSLLAALDLAQRFAHDAVVRQASRVLALAAPDDTSTRWRALLLRQRALRLSGQRDAQAQDLDALLALADATANPVWQATVALRRTVAADETGQRKQAAALAPLAMAAVERAGWPPPEKPGDVSLELAVYGVWCGALRATGHHAEAQRIGEKGLARARELGERGPESELLVALAAIAVARSDTHHSVLHLRQAIHIQQSLGNRSGECVSRVNLGTAAHKAGDLTTAAVEFERALGLAERLGNMPHQTFVLLNQASVQLAQRKPMDALASAWRAQKMAQRIRNPEYEAYALMTQGAAQLASMQTSGAHASFAQSRAMLDELGLPHLSVEAVAWLGLAALRSGQTATALEHVNQVLTHQAQNGHFDGTEDPLQILWTCCEVLRAAADERFGPVLAVTWDALQARLATLRSSAEKDLFLAIGHHRLIAETAVLRGLAHTGH